MPSVFFAFRSEFLVWEEGPENSDAKLVLHRLESLYLHIQDAYLQMPFKLLN